MAEAGAGCCCDLVFPAAGRTRLVAQAVGVPLSATIGVRVRLLREGEVAEIKRLEGHLVDALAPRGDEGRGTLR